MVPATTSEKAPFPVPAGPSNSGSRLPSESQRARATPRPELPTAVICPSAETAMSFRSDPDGVISVVTNPVFAGPKVMSRAPSVS